MKFKTCKTSDRWSTEKEEVNINSLEELIQFMDDNDTIIINRSYDNDGELLIEIYDDYRE